MRQASEERNSLTRVVHFAAYHQKTTFGKQVSDLCVYCLNHQKIFLGILRRIKKSYSL